MGSRVIPCNTWMWLTPCNSIHTMMLRESLSLVFLDKDQQICEIVQEIKPWRIHVCLLAASVLEASCLDSVELMKVIPRLQEKVLQRGLIQTR